MDWINSKFIDIQILRKLKDCRFPTQEPFLLDLGVIIDEGEVKRRLKKRTIMTGFLQWKCLSEDQVIQLESVTDELEIRRLLSEYFRIEEIPAKKQAILCNFHFFNYA